MDSSSSNPWINVSLCPGNCRAGLCTNTVPDHKCILTAVRLSTRHLSWFHHQCQIDAGDRADYTSHSRPTEPHTGCLWTWGSGPRSHSDTSLTFWVHGLGSMCSWCTVTVLQWLSLSLLSKSLRATLIQERFIDHFENNVEISTLKSKLYFKVQGYLWLHAVGFSSNSLMDNTKQSSTFGTC